MGEIENQQLIRNGQINNPDPLICSFYASNGKLMYRNANNQHIDYYYLGGKLVANKKGNTVTYLHSDYLGSTAAESTTSGGVTARMHYQPFGESIEPPKDDVGYTGHKFDTDLGLSYMQARYYDPVIGRFYSNDPIGFRDIHSFNRYAYANNNPFSFVDPDGMQSKPSQKVEEKRERQAALDNAKAERKVALTASSGLGANKMYTTKETHDGLDSQVTQDVMSDEATIAKAFCGCDSIQQRVEQFDAASASEFNNAAAIQNGVYQTAVAAIPVAQALKAKDVITGSLAALGASNAVNHLQSAPTVHNGDIVVTTTSMVSGGGRGNVHVSVVRTNQSVD